MPITSVTLAERVSAAIESGVVNVDWADLEESEVWVTAGELAVFLSILIPEEYPRVADPMPTSAPPGTPRKIDELRRRMENGLGLWCDEDADMQKAKGTLSKGRGKKGFGVIFIGES